MMSKKEQKKGILLGPVILDESKGAPEIEYIGELDPHENLRKIVHSSEEPRLGGEVEEKRLPEQLPLNRDYSKIWPEKERYYRGDCYLCGGKVYWGWNYEGQILHDECKIVYKLFLQLKKTFDFLENTEDLQGFLNLLPEKFRDELYAHPLLKEMDLLP